MCVCMYRGLIWFHIDSLPYGFTNTLIRSLAHSLTHSLTYSYTH